MADILHQQRLFLELLVMSGNIAMPDKDDGTVLFRTMKECESAGWVATKQFGAGFSQASVTESGRRVVNNRRDDSDRRGDDRRQKNVEMPPLERRIGKDSRSTKDLRREGR